MSMAIATDLEPEDAKRHTNGVVREVVLGLAQRTSGTRSPTLGHALTAAITVRNTADAYLVELVAMARAEGATWAEIGTALGVSTQAAHQRYGRRDRAGRPRADH